MPLFLDSFNKIHEHISATPEKLKTGEWRLFDVKKIESTIVDSTTVDSTIVDSPSETKLARTSEKSLIKNRLVN